MKKYHVYSKATGQQYTVEAASPAAAKKEFCRLFGLNPADKWTGAKTLVAHEA